MNYTIKQDVDYIENITKIKNKVPVRIDDQKIIKGYKIVLLDKCYQMMSPLSNSVPWEIAILNSTSDYLVKKEIPFAITERRSGATIQNILYVYGTEIKIEKSESKKIGGPDSEKYLGKNRSIVDENWEFMGSQNP